MEDRMETNVGSYLDKAVNVLEKFPLIKSGDEEAHTASLLERVVSVDQPKVLAIARTLKYSGDFDQLVRDKIEDIKVSDRYSKINNMFDTIREDCKELLRQLEDGKIDTKEKIGNVWMKLTRGSPHKRFEKIRETYLDVADDTKEALQKEQEIMEAYLNFRFALKEAEAFSMDVLKQQETIFKQAKTDYSKTAEEVKANQGKDPTLVSKLELVRDETANKFREEDKKYQLIKDISENLTIGYNVGETLMQKIQQTHDVKDQVYQKAIIFFRTNQHVFTFLDAAYTAQQGLHESTQTLEAMKQGMNKGLEDIAEFGGKVDRAGLEAGYGTTINKEAVQKLVDAIVTY